MNTIKKYDLINKNNPAIYTNGGPRFGASDFNLGCNKKNMKNCISYANKRCNFLSNNNLELTGGKGDHENFEPEELEVYKVILK